MELRGEYQKAINFLYGDKDAAKQVERYSKLAADFKTHFGDRPIELFSSPGRTELGGNHTDHNHGRVLAASVNLDSIAVAAKNETNVITLYSEGYEKSFVVHLSELDVIDSEKGETNALIRGIAARFSQLGYQIGGFDACVTSDVLPGSGLSSSASIEVLIGTILNSFYNEDSISPEEIAIAGQFAENNYFGKPCGLMDQTACAVGGIITIDFADPENPLVEQIDFDFAGRNFSLVVVDTGGNHADLTDDYAAVPAEMKSIAAHLGKRVCRDLELTDLIDNIGILRKEAGDRAVLRAFHFLKENQRVVEQVDALKNQNLEKFLTLINESGNSSFKWLQNIYTGKNVSEQGVTIALALTEHYLGEGGCGACRVHGGGFAGTMQAFMPNHHVVKYIQLLEPVFGKNSVLVLNIRSRGALNLNNLML